MYHTINSYTQAKALGIKIMCEALKKYTSQQLAAHFDIDGTLLDDTPKGLYVEGRTTYLKPIKSIVDLSQWARRHNIKVVIITARPNTPHNILWTRKNLQRANIHYDQLLFLKSTDDPAKFKPLVKKSLSAVFKYRFVLSVGDREVDVAGPVSVSGIGIKLPTRT